ncbi:MAG: transporter substrate-binding domain-containing protein, partial [Paracoccus sp. (in: a-proteobacteria)]|nr:transporter substrate-binding domain-containing protein [Paracoccus sp. (in: a-proteobacteria)]
MRVRIWLVSALMAWAAAVQAQVADLRSHSALRVCADPANAPISSQDGSGFENRIARLLAEKMNLPVQYFWFPQTTGFVRKGLRDGNCDLIVGYAQGDELVQNTNHYYTSVYVLITLTGGDLAEVTTLTDPRLRGRQIGLVAGTPPGDHLAR